MSGFSKGRKKRSAPIQNIDKVDIAAARREGGVDLFIVVSGPLDGSPETQKLLLDKIESYLDQLNTEEFQGEFGHPPPEKVKIIVACAEDPDPVIVELIDRSQPWVKENNARLELEVANKA